MRIVRFFLLALFALAALPAQAQVVAVESWIEQWDEASQQWVRISDPVVEPVADAASPGAERFAPARPALPVIARKSASPFRLLDEHRVLLDGPTDAASPAQFAALLRAHPGLDTLEMGDCPGTENDRANMELGRMIRAAGLATHVGRTGSVRSGAVELFLAGATRTVDDGAEFAVHSWMDIYGRGPRDFAVDAPANWQYLDYYREMGMSEAGARDFYAMTNAARFDEARWLDAAAMRRWLAQTGAAAPRIEPQLAGLDLAATGASVLDSRAALP